MHNAEKTLHSFAASVADVLKQHDMVFEFKSPTHVVIEGIEDYYDYWPTTGKWIYRKHKLHGYGLRMLRKHYQGEYELTF